MSDPDATATFPRRTALDEKLIEAVKIRRPLWDNADPLYRNVKVLIFMWQQVAQELNLSEIVVKKKWKSLRDYFTRQVKELKKSTIWKAKGPSDKEQLKICNKYCLWPLYDKLTFLLENDYDEKHEKSIRKMNAEDVKLLEEIKQCEKQNCGEDGDLLQERSHETVEVECQVSIGKHVLSSLKPSCSTDVPEIQIISSTETLCEPTPIQLLKTPSASCSGDSIKKGKGKLQKKSNRIRSALCISPPLKKMKLLLDDPLQIDECDTESDLLFFKSLLPFMSELPSRNKLRLRNAIHDLIIHEYDVVASNVEDSDSLPNRDMSDTREEEAYKCYQENDDDRNETNISVEFEKDEMEKVESEDSKSGIEVFIECNRTTDEIKTEPDIEYITG